MSTLMKASHQWSTRPADERFTSLGGMHAHFETIRNQCKATVAPSRRVFAQPAEDNRGLEIVGGGDNPHAPTNWAFGQIAQLAEAPAGYLRTLPSPIAADCINYGLQFKRSIEDVGLLLQDNGDAVLRAATGPNYGRIWNSDVLAEVIRRFGDGDGDWTVPGEFGRAVEITKANTTLFAGDRDMFIFLADEKHRIEVPNRRNGQSGSLARGFFMWNSEVGSATFGLGTFLFDYVCCNRIVWGAEGYREVRIRHTASAPEKYLEDMQPALEAYAASSALSITEAVRKAQEARLEDKVDEFLEKRFGKRMVQPLKLAHVADEGRPIETLWDVTTAATAYARGLKWQDQRVAIERTAGKILDEAA